MLTIMTERERLTITMRRDLLKRVDQVIDGAQIRNRSHAIEYLLSSALPPAVRKAFVLAGGPGIKMRPLTYELPKTMIPVNGRPILEHIIELLRDNEIRDILILVGHLGDKIRSYFGDGSKFGVRLTYLEEGTRSGTAIPLLKARSILGSETFLMIYGDVLAKINLRDLISFHEHVGKLATMAVTSVDQPSDWGVVGLQGDRIVSFTEKPHRPGVSHNINAGIFVMQPELIDLVPRKTFSMLEKDVFPKLAKNAKLAGYQFEGQWFDIATPEIYEKALRLWRK